eukprot:CAMPEP_0184384744 /NCGR_PEP_ID=MMETSP0007-20130409/8141_1 /TAXON_ID=97485 /ORGANISM="Prymnesium parvum, Strain Texoma1" /LENGTH=104 /DNA_ID=CAMNT_0026731719 /DNA_START=142 /DNA_END=456 /DNA_ORIENTATION=-
MPTTAAAKERKQEQPHQTERTKNGTCTRRIRRRQPEKEWIHEPYESRTDSREERPPGSHASRGGKNEEPRADEGKSLRYVSMAPGSEAREGKSAAFASEGTHSK